MEIYEGMFHGWMGAKVDLENEEQKAEYVRGYVVTSGGKLQWYED